MRTTVDVDAHLLRLVRADARRRGVSFKEALAGAIRRGLADDAPKAARKKYRCPAYPMGTPAYDLEKALVIAAAIEDDEAARELSLRK